jgi:hypothetical protein
MILENTIEKWGYASLLVADYHLEYPLSNPATIVWNPHDLHTISYILRNGNEEVDYDEIAKGLFRGLDKRYNGYWDPHMCLWQIRGSMTEIYTVFSDLAKQLMGGPQGADDDTFDYWPNAYEMLIVLAKDLIELGYHYPKGVLATVDHVVKTALAIHGPFVEWEAESVPAMRDELATIATNKEA